jgi:hypothetical protein
MEKAVLRKPLTGSTTCQYPYICWIDWYFKKYSLLHGFKLGYLCSMILVPDFRILFPHPFERGWISEKAVMRKPFRNFLNPRTPLKIKECLTIVCHHVQCV